MTAVSLRIPNPCGITIVHSVHRLRRSFAAQPPNDKLNGKDSSLREASMPTREGEPTRFHGQPRGLHQPHRIAYHRIAGNAVRGAIPDDLGQAENRRGGPAEEQRPYRDGTRWAPAMQRCGYRRCNPHRRTANLWRGVLFRRCIRWLRKSWRLTPVRVVRLSFGLACLLLVAAQQGDYLSSELPHALQGPCRHVQDLVKKPAHDRKKLEHALQTLSGVPIARSAGSQFLNAFAQDSQSRVNFATFTLFGDDAENFPHILERFEMVAPVSEDVNDPYDAPALQFAQAGAHIRARHRKRLGDFVGRDRFG